MSNELARAIDASRIVTLDEVAGLLKEHAYRQDLAQGCILDAAHRPGVAITLDHNMTLNGRGGHGFCDPAKGWVFKGNLNEVSQFTLGLYELLLSYSDIDRTGVQTCHNIVSEAYRQAQIRQA